MLRRDVLVAGTGRLCLACCVVEDGWPLRQAAERFQVSPMAAKRWAGRYRASREAGMVDRSNCPRMPTRTERRIMKVWVARRWGRCGSRACCG